MPQKGQNKVFFNLTEILAIGFFWICSIMKIYIIYCVPVQVPYLVPEIWVRMFTANSIAGFLIQLYL